MRYLGNEVTEAVALAFASRAAGNVQGPVVDRLSYDQGLIIAYCGAATGSPSAQSVKFQLQHGAASSGSGMVDVPAAKLATSVITITADSTYSRLSFDARALNRYIRLDVTTAFTSGSTPEIISGAFFVLGFAQTEPVSA